LRRSQLGRLGARRFIRIDEAQRPSSCQSQASCPCEANASGGSGWQIVSSGTAAEIEHMGTFIRIGSVAAFAATLAVCGAAKAGGFAVLSQSGSQMGNAFATGAAGGEDASTVWYNPAGMGRLRGTNASGVLNVIQASSKFQNTGSTGAFANPGSGEGGDAGGVAIVPQAYAVTSVDDRLRLGVGLNSPFGLKTEYDAGWRGQLTALRSEQSTYNLNPSVAYRVRDRLWLGAGVSVQRMTTELTNFAGPLGEARLKASDNAWGFNLGALFDVNDDARIGIAYRSVIRFKPSGSATFASGGGTFDSAVRTELTVPETVMLNGLVRFGRDWEVMGGATWTRWSRLGMLTVTRTSASALGPEGSVLATLPFNWRNTVMLAVGANWRLDDDARNHVELRFTQPGNLFRTPTSRPSTRGAERFS
jgi:long-chain fatty acid transport protein